MSSAERARSRIGGEIIMAVRRKDRGIDVRIAVVPEADAITPHGVVVDIVNGEWPEHRPDPSISAVAVSPPPVRRVAAAPAPQPRAPDALPAHRRVAKPAIRTLATAFGPSSHRPGAAS